MDFSAKHMLVLLFLSGVSASYLREVSGIDKVIQLLEELKGEVETDGKTEATSYDTFACWCKDTSKTKSESITTGEDTISSLSAEIESKSDTKALKQQEKTDKKAKYEKLLVDLQDSVTSCTKAKAEYEFTAADFGKALSSLDSAITSMKTGKNFQPSAAFLELADALGMLVSKKQQAMSAFLQQKGKVDPADPEYKFHSDDIIKMLTDLREDFGAKKKSLDDEWAKTDSACKTTQSNLDSEITTTNGEIEALTQRINSLTSEIAATRGSLIQAESSMKDDQLYLRDLTKECEDRALEWDQRSSMRAKELTALSKALTFLKGDAKTYIDVNALLVQKGSMRPAAGQRNKAVNLLQIHRQSRGALSMQARQDKALAIVREAGQKLTAPMLSALAMKIAADPFLEVKKLIQDLIQRLLAESTAEASKKGFCDTEVAKAKLERDNRFAEVRSLSTKLEKLEAKKDLLTNEISELDKELDSLNTTLTEAISNRASDKAQNEATLEKAKKGLAAVEEALEILKSFYKTAARAKDVALMQESPIAGENPGAGYGTGAYKGKQDGSTAIIALVTQLKEDYESTIKTTEANEKQSLADFVKFERTSKSSTSAKETKKELNTQDLKTTNVNIEQSTSDLTSAQLLLDGALKALEELKPTCVDSGMSYAERVAKREEEIAALKNALCILDPAKTEAECQ